ncbi:MAG TPA: hypothetical protein VGI64_10890 [Streptosporangiaceae bacterium]
MTEPRDQVNRWLAGEVTPLTPRPGALETIRRRARRRKRHQALAVGAACALVIAVGVSIPHFLPGRTGRGSSPHPPVAVSQKPPAIGASSSPLAGESTGPDTGRVVQLHQRTMLTPGASDTVPPPNFQPTSVTMVGTGTGGLVGAVIGQAGTPGHCATAYCTSLAGTSDYGNAWYGVSAPVTSGPDGDAGVSQLRFANLNDGWAFGPALWETSRGGWPWHQEDTFGQRVLDVEAADGHAFAVFGTCTGTGADYAADCTSFALYTSVAGSTTWTPVAVPAAFGHMSSGISATPLLVIAGGTTGFLLTPSGALLSGPVTGGPWNLVTQAPCAPGPADASQDSPAHPGTQFSAGPKLLLACGNGEAGATAAATLYTSTDGTTWQKAGPIAVGSLAPGGVATSLTSASAGQAVLATTSAILYSADGGTTWRKARLAPGSAPAGGFSYVGMTTATQGVAVPADAQAGEIFVTQNGGRTWTPAPITG